MLSRNLRVFCVSCVVCCLFPVSNLQHIFDTNLSTCEYVLEDKNEAENHEYLSMTAKPWQVAGKGKVLVHFSPCGNPLPPSAGCSPGAAACFRNLKFPKKSVLNAGKHFTYTTDEQSGKNILKSVSGQHCTETENYTVIIQFACDPRTKATPRYLYKDDCEVRLEMMHFSCPMACTTRINNHLIDLRPMQALGPMDVIEPTTNQTFTLSFCKAASQCESDAVLACETNGDTNIAIGSTDWQHFTYDIDENILVYSSHSERSKKVRKNLEIRLKCDWTVQGISNLKYLRPQTQGRNYKFEGKSSLACVKFPQNCVIGDSPEYNFIVYNLTKLYKINGYWEIQDANLGTIYLNVCGPLQALPAGTQCYDQHSQVCLKNKTGHYINLGSIFSHFHVQDDVVKGAYIYGSTCAVNASFTYTTEIEFLCNAREKGPKLMTVSNCTFKIKWETPAACSKYFVTGEKCTLSDSTGNINLRDIYKTTDKVYNFQGTSYLKYNLCGPLKQPCRNKVRDVSVCLITNNEEHVVGYSNEMLMRDHTSLRLTLQGDKCSSDVKSTAKVFFHCDHSASLIEAVNVNKVSDCAYEINYYTKLACPSFSHSQCKVYNNNKVFDLTPLSRNGSDYIIQSDHTTIYIMNVCRSITNAGNTICPHNSGACMQNLSEPHEKYKYLSLGTVSSESTPTVENGEVIIRYKMGKLCLEEANHHVTTIRFQCSTQEESPRLLKKASCSHEFLWRTQHACGKQVLSVKTRSTRINCNYTNENTGKIIDLGNINKVLHIHGKDNYLYKFNLCESNYSVCDASDTNCAVFQASREFLRDETDSLYLSYILNNNIHNKTLNRLYIYLQCNLQNSSRFSLRRDLNNAVYIDLFTKNACTEKETNVPGGIKLQLLSNVTKKVPYETTHTAVSVPNILSSQILEKDCLITNSKTNVSAHLEDIMPTALNVSLGANHTISINNGTIYRDQHKVALEECPVFNDNQSAVLFRFFGIEHSRCSKNPDYTQLFVRCSLTNESPYVLKETGECNVTIVYPTKEACALLENTKQYDELVTSGAGIAIGTSVGSLFTVLLIGIFFIFKKNKDKICSNSEYNRLSENKGSVRVYLKDLTL